MREKKKYSVQIAQSQVISIFSLCHAWFYKTNGVDLGGGGNYQVQA